MGIVAENNHYNKVYKRFVLWLVGITFFFTCGNAWVNYTLDPYGVFGTWHNFEDWQGGNDRFIKLDYLKKYHSEYNSYLMGSSRIGRLTTVKEIEKYIPNSKFYNAWVSSGNIIDADIFLEFMLKNHYEIQNYYIQVGLEYSERAVDYRIFDDTSRKWHYEITHTSAFNFYTPYLFGWQYYGIKQKILRKLDKRELVTYSVKEGTYAMPTLAEEMDSDLEGYIKKEDTFHDNLSLLLPKLTPRKRMLNKQKLEHALKNISQNCTEYKINCILTIEPHHFRIIEWLGEEDRAYLLEIFANSFPQGFWMFAYYNSITTEHKNYYERVHHLESINSLIFARIFGDKSVSVPEDFGIFITKENLKQSLEKIRVIEARYKPHLPLHSKNTP